MPLYEYRCESCGHTFEVIQRFSDPLIETCQACGGSVQKLLSPPAIQFKGSGWYITDYARKGQSATTGKEAAAPADSRSAEPAKTGCDSAGDTKAPATRSSTSS